MSRLLAALLALFLACPNALLGQAGTPTTAVVPGARVRITQIDQKPRVAVVVSRTADTLRVRWPDLANTTAAVPVADISRLEVSGGRHRNVLKGMAVGTLGLGTVGVVLGAATYSPCDSTEPFGCLLASDNRAEEALMVGALGAAVGLIVGTLVGLPSRESWRRVPLDATRVAVSIIPRGGATGVGLSLRF